MKIMMTLLVKNEIDIIEAHVRYHRPKVDHVVVMDNMSTDGTSDVLASLARELGGVTVLTMASDVYDQERWVARMVRHCAEMGADWVLNSDADEFWVGDLRYVVDAFWGYGANVVYPGGTTFRPTEMDDLSEPNPVKRMLHCDPDTVEFDSKKVIHATQGFESIEQGNHFMKFYPFIKDSVQDTTSLRLYHYPHRGEDQFVSKHRGAWSETKLEQMGVGWRGINQVCAEGGEEALRRYYRERIVLSYEAARERGMVRDDSVREEVSK